MTGDRGFSLLEVVLAVGITLAVVAAVFTMVTPAVGAFETGIDVAEMQQRLRVAADALTRDLTGAGAGPFSGGHVGSLVHHLAPVLPFRRGQSGDDPPETFRDDTITIVAVPSTSAQTTLAADLRPSELTLQAAAGPGCATGINLCGFGPGMTILVYDDAGTADAFRIEAVDDASLQLTLSARPAGSADATFRRGSTVVEAQVRTYYLRTDARAQTFELMRSDGPGSQDVPVVDHVVGLTFDYDGDPQAPGVSAGGVASYGPSPPAEGTRPTAYPIGENCAFRIDEVSGLPVARLLPLTAGLGLTSLTAAQFRDGPWCPDDTSANRWDADLLRIRRIGVTIRVEAALAALRGPAGVLFANGGSARAASRWAPDVAIRLRVSPRNMKAGWE